MVNLKRISRDGNGTLPQVAKPIGESDRDRSLTDPSGAEERDHRDYVAAQIPVPLTRAQIERLPAELQEAHRDWVETDLRNEKINYKVREHSLAKVPVLAVVGKREAEKREVALRRLGGNEQEVLALEEALNRLKVEARPPAGKSGSVPASGAF